MFPSVALETSLALLIRPIRRQVPHLNMPEVETNFPAAVVGKEVRQLAINPTNHTRNSHKIEKHAPRLGRGSKSSKTSNAETRGSHM